jgi:hypothetical protein
MPWYSHGHFFTRVCQPHFFKSLWSDEPVVYLAFYDTSRRPDYFRDRWSFPKLFSHLNLDHFHRQTVKAAVFTNRER